MSDEKVSSIPIERYKQNNRLLNAFDAALPEVQRAALLILEESAKKSRKGTGDVNTISACRIFNFPDVKKDAGSS